MSVKARTLEEIDADLRAATDPIDTELLLDERCDVMHAEEKNQP